MRTYIALALMLDYIVNLLLLLASARMSGSFCRFFRCALGSLVGTVYGVLCFVPSLWFLSNLLWRTVFVAITALVTFGLSKDAVRPGIFYALLRMAMDGLTGDYGQFTQTLWAFLLMGVCLYAVYGRHKGRYVPVELHYGGKTVQCVALRDTGNTLKDPMTGRGVLVADADVAQRLLGLTVQQLRRPVEAIGLMQGLQLIPYKTVSGSGQMMLAISVPKATVAGRKQRLLVAFSSEKLDEKGLFQALIGGMV